jgi:fermentation-respiration switch protein FrsA (DUF1100 family)
MESTSADLAGDVKAGVAFLKGQPRIDATRIGLIGHSEGGLIAPIVAAECPDVAFIVLLAGTGVPGDEILTEQIRLISLAEGEKAEEVEKQLEVIRRMIAAVKENEDPEARKSALLAIAKESGDLLTDRAKAEGTAATETKEEASDETTAQVMASQFGSPWFRYFLTYDPRPTLAKVTCPVLALNGEKDLQVWHAQNLPAIEEALRKGGNGVFEARMLPGLNHLFQPATTGSPSEYAKIELTMDETVPALVARWILELPCCEE